MNLLTNLNRRKIMKDLGVSDVDNVNIFVEYLPCHKFVEY